MVALGQAGAVAEGDQVVGQLADVGAVGHADIERPVGGDRAVEERHRFVAERVDGLVLPDDVAHLRQRGVGRARVRRGGLQRRQGGLVALQPGLVGDDLGLVLVVVTGRARLGGGQLLLGLGQLGLVLADLLGVLAARRAWTPPSRRSPWSSAAWSELRADWAVLTLVWAAAIAWLSAARRVGFGLLVGGQGLLVLGHRLLGLGDLLGACPRRRGDGVGAVVADRAADLHRIGEGGPHHRGGG